MVGLENENLKNEGQNVNTCEDEIDLMDYFLVLWKRKWFILFASVLPALIVGLFFFFSPRASTFTFTYNQVLDGNDIRILEGVFYSEANIERLVKKLQTAGFEDCAGKLAKAGSFDELKKIVSLSTLPLLGDLPEAQQTQSGLLSVRITLNSKKDIRQTALVFRENIEKVVPLYLEKESLNQSVMGFRDKMAGIEEARYELNLQLERKKSSLKRLNNLSSDGLNKLPSDNVTLQFSDANSSVYMPLPRQIVNLEEQVMANNEMYAYSADLLKLSERLLGYVDKAITDGTLEQFRSYLVSALAEYKDSVQIADYLGSYIKRLENKMANNIPITDKPRIYPVAKGTVKNSSIVFVIAFMVSVFAAFLREGLEKHKPQLS